ncbi:MAG: hypothetical protein H0U85_08035 [Gemmatimonadales bacterium]|nr:hypothetical protein [Gemmatimonadales bacterium]
MDSPREILASLRPRLIRLHKALVESERVTYERVHGRVSTKGELLQLVIHDSWFVWLRPVSELIVRIDELLDADAEATDAGAGPVISEARALLAPAPAGPGFAAHYYEALQRDPAVVLAHADVMRTLTG